MKPKICRRETWANNGRLKEKEDSLKGEPLLCSTKCNNVELSNASYA